MPVQTLERQTSVRELHKPFEGYSKEPTPLGGYALFMGLYGVAMAGFLWSKKRQGSRLDGLSVADLVLLGIASHKVSRLVTKDWVTAPLRAPFTEYQGSAGFGEVNERARGEGLQRATGELLTCPWCFGAWTAAGFTYSFSLFPRFTRFVASLFAVETIQDYLQVAYEKLKKDGARRHGDGNSG